MLHNTRARKIPTKSICDEYMFILILLAGSKSGHDPHRRATQSHSRSNRLGPPVGNNLPAIAHKPPNAAKSQALLAL